jgi:fatty-acyl-CoA synthase
MPEVTEAEIVAFCRERMARFKVPKRVVFGPVPKTSTGKVQKFVLRELARQM